MTLILSLATFLIVLSIIFPHIAAASWFFSGFICFLLALDLIVEGNKNKKVLFEISILITVFVFFMIIGIICCLA